MFSSAKLLLPADYVNDATKHIKLAKKRVSLLSMVIADDESTNELIEALCSAAERGVTVEVAADIFTYSELGGFLLPTSYRSKKSRETNKMSRRFKKSGVKFNWLGKTRATIFSGRTHVKWCIIDDIVYSFGGVNLYQKGIDNADYIFKLYSSTLADSLINEYRRLVEADAGGYSYKSHKISYDNDIILIDGGLFGDSIIYRQACHLTAKANRVRLVSQYCPTGKLARLLKNTNHELYFNPPSQATGLNKPVISLGMIISGNKTLYDKPRYLHAKFMLFDMPNGCKVALTGSHNFANTGVLLGTREIALQTDNHKIISQLEKFYQDFIV